MVFSMSRRGWAKIVAVGVLVLLVIPVVGLSASGWFQHNSANGPTALLTGPPRPSSSRTATISGTLSLAGSAFGGPTPISGQVTIADVEQIGDWWLGVPVAVGADGRFTVEVPPGLYQVGGESPMYQGGKGSCRPARTPVRVSDGNAVVVNVFCEMK